MTIVLSENFRALLRALLCRPCQRCFQAGGGRGRVATLVRPAGGGPGAARWRGRRDVGRAAARPDRARQEPGLGSRLFLRRGGARSVLRGRCDAAPGFQVRRSPVDQACDGLGSADAVGLPAGRPAPRRRRSREGRPRRRQEHGRERGCPARRQGRCRAGLPALRRSLVSTGAGYIWNAAAIAASPPTRHSSPGAASSPIAPKTSRA